MKYVANWRTMGAYDVGAAPNDAVAKATRKAMSSALEDTDLETVADVAKGINQTNQAMQMAKGLTSGPKTPLPSASDLTSSVAKGATQAIAAQALQSAISGSAWDGLGNYDHDEMSPTEQYDDIGPEEGGGIDEDVISHYPEDIMGFDFPWKKAAVATVPGAGPTLAAAKAAKDPRTKHAGQVLAKARNGDKASKARILATRKQAAAGDPNAKKNLAALHAINNAAKGHSGFPLSDAYERGARG